MLSCSTENKNIKHGKPYFNIYNSPNIVANAISESRKGNLQIMATKSGEYIKIGSKKEEPRKNKK